MLPKKDYPPAIIHYPLDHLRMDFHAKLGVYRCNLPGCPLAYTSAQGYFSIADLSGSQARESLYAQAAICLCEHIPNRASTQTDSTPKPHPITIPANAGEGSAFLRLCRGAL
jgi:hypothetical protein